MMHTENKSVHFAQLQYNNLKIKTAKYTFFCNFVT